MNAAKPQPDPEEAATAAEAFPPEASMHPDIADSWHLWSEIIGRTAVRHLESLREDLGELHAAVLATEDGLHLCSIDLDEDDAGRLAAMNSSLFAVAHAEAVAMGHGDEAAGATVVTISTGASCTALASFTVPAFGRLLLAISAQDVSQGSLVLRTRSTAREISEWLSTSDLTGTIGA